MMFFTDILDIQYPESYYGSVEIKKQPLSTYIGRCGDPHGREVSTHLFLKPFANICSGHGGVPSIQWKRTIIIHFNKKELS
jgi:hypothetical protein